MVGNDIENDDAKGKDKRTAPGRTVKQKSQERAAREAAPRDRGEQVEKATGDSDAKSETCARLGREARDYCGRRKIRARSARLEKEPQNFRRDI